MFYKVSFSWGWLLCVSISLPSNHVWNAIVVSGLVVLVATCNCWISNKNRLARLLVLHLLPLFEPSADCQNIPSLSLFYRYYFGKSSSELTQLVPLPYCWGRSTRYSDRLHDFSVTIPRYYKDVYVNSFFPRTARLWNS